MNKIVMAAKKYIATMDKDKVTEFIAHQTMAIEGLTQNNRALSEALRQSSVPGTLQEEITAIVTGLELDSSILNSAMGDRTNVAKRLLIYANILRELTSKEK